MLTDDKIINLIITGEWEEVLFQLTEDMDPWNVDLVKLTNRFMDYIKKTTEMDLRIPAKILLAAAVLYRMKAYTLQQDEAPEPEAVEDYEIELTSEMDDTGNRINIPPIMVPAKRTPKRRVTIDELVEALGKAMKIKKRREAREIFQVNLKGENITKMIEGIYEKLSDLFENGEKVTFTKVLGKKPTKTHKIKSFNSLLHLSNQERITCHQDELFGEIYISKSQEA